MDRDRRHKNGCLRYVPGSHKARTLFPHVRDDRDTFNLNQVFGDRDSAERNAKDVVLEPGQLSFHDAYLVHGSGANRSANRRFGFVLRYMPTTSYFDHELAANQTRERGIPDFSGRQLDLVRGIDRCGRNDFKRKSKPLGIAEAQSIPQTSV